MDKKKLTILGALIGILFLVFFHISCAQSTEKSTEPVVEYREGKVLETLPRGAPHPNIPRNPIKEAKQWSEMWSMEYAEICEINPGEEKIYPIELTNPSIIFVKVYFFKAEPEKLSVQLYQEGQEQPFWNKNATMLREYLSLVSDQIDITAEMVMAEKNWRIKLINGSNQKVTTEVMIGIVDLTVKSE